MDASPKLQKAGRAFLLRLVAENGAEEAARILRDMAEEVADLPAMLREESPHLAGVTTEVTTGH
jgi:hypothetical protein